MIILLLLDYARDMSPLFCTTHYKILMFIWSYFYVNNSMSPNSITWSNTMEIYTFNMLTFFLISCSPIFLLFLKDTSELFIFSILTF